MSETEATIGFGVKLEVSDGGETNGTKATKTIGTSNQQVLYTAKKAGTAANSYTIAHVNPGNNGSLAVSVIGNAISVTLATDGSGVVTSTASDVVDAVNASAAAAAKVVASNGAGNGSGLAVAASAAAMTGGAAGAAVYTEIAEVTNLNLSGEETSEIDATHMGSPSRRREYISGLIDPGTCDFDLNFLPGNATQQLLKTLQTSGERVDWRITWTDDAATKYGFQGWVKTLSYSGAMDDKLTSSCSVRITGPIEEV